MTIETPPLCAHGGHVPSTLAGSKACARCGLVLGVNAWGDGVFVPAGDSAEAVERAGLAIGIPPTACKHATPTGGCMVWHGADRETCGPCPLCGALVYSGNLEPVEILPPMTFAESLRELQERAKA